MLRQLANCVVVSLLSPGAAALSVNGSDQVVGMPPESQRDAWPITRGPATDAEAEALEKVSVGSEALRDLLRNRRFTRRDELNNAMQAALTTGGDNCNDTTIVPVAAGSPGNPNIVTINGDSSAATGGGCDPGLGIVWWEAIELDKCADVIIDFCGTDPTQSLNYVSMLSACAPDGSSCSGYIGWSGGGRGMCPGETPPGNITMFFDELPPGTFYYPIIANEDRLGHPPGPYVMHISAEECTGACTGCLGACCNTDTQLCVEDVEQTSCDGAQQVWSARARCCESECRDAAGPEYDALDVELLVRVPIGDFPSGSQSANDVWGYISPRGRRYAIIGLSHGTGFADITDPRNPVVVADIPDAASTWSDMAVYREYAYNVNENSGGMQIIDLTDMDSGTVTLLGSAVGGMETAHNVYVNPLSGHAYPCGTDIVPGFVAFDLSDPTDPQPVGTWNDHYIHDLHVVNYDSCPVDPPHPRSGQPCEIAFAAGENRVYIVDATDKSAMTTISHVDYPTVEYCHQCWVSDDRRYLFFNDELDESRGAVSSTRTYVADVQNLSSPSLVHTYDHPGCWIDHNLITRGGRIYHAHYAAGLRVVDAGDPLALSEIAYFDTHPESNVQDFVGAWGVYSFPERIVLISDMERGLFVLCDEPDRPVPGFTVDQNPGSCAESISFDATGSTTCDPDRTLVTYEWDLDYDGVSFNVDATGSTTTHAYGAGGEYTVALRVTDDLAVQETSTLAISVSECIPAVSEWGLVAMTLLVLSAGTLVLTKRRSPSTA